LMREPMAVSIHDLHESGGLDIKRGKPISGTILVAAAGICERLEALTIVLDRIAESAAHIATAAAETAAVLGNIDEQGLETHEQNPLRMGEVASKSDLGPTVPDPEKVASGAIVEPRAGED